MEYLKSRDALPSVALLLLLGLLYQLLNQPIGVANVTSSTDPRVMSAVMLLNQPIGVANATAPLLCLALVLMVVRAPRWSLYLCLLAALAAYLWVYTQVLAFSPARSGSCRDKAAIEASLALLQGMNPWNHAPKMSAPITTGAASVLLVLPAVRVFGNLAILTYVYWLGIFGFVMACDVRLRNKAFPTIAILTMTGMFGFAHTMEWRLDEIYFPYPFFLLAYYFITRRKFFVSGLFLAIPPLCRVSYGFMVVGFLLWHVFQEGPVIRNLARLVAGLLSATVVILAPFLAIGGREFWEHNFYSVTKVMGELGEWQNTNVLFQVMSRFTSWMQPAGVRILKQLLAVLVLAGVAWGLRRRKIIHPFWHITAAAFLSHTIVWHHKLWLDYALIFIVPTYFAVALTRREVGLLSSEGA